MRRRPLSRTRQPVSPDKHILRVLLDGRSTENAIYRRLKQTGLYGMAYKQKILYAIDRLEEAGFIVDVSGLKRHDRHDKGKRRHKELTALGRDLAEIIDSSNKYYESYRRLTDTIVQALFDIPFKRENMPYTRKAIARGIEAILRNKGVSDGGIDPEELYEKTIQLIEFFSPKYIYNAVIMRYVFVISKYHQNVENVNAVVRQDILKELITNAISEHVSFIFESYNNDKLNQLSRRLWFGTVRFESEPYKTTFDELAWETIVHMSHDHTLHSCIVEKELIDTCLYFISILKPDSEHVVRRIDDYKNFLNQQGNTSINEAEINHKKKMLALLEEYKRTRK